MLVSKTQPLLDSNSHFRNVLILTASHESFIKSPIMSVTPQFPPLQISVRLLLLGV